MESLVVSAPAPQEGVSIVESIVDNPLVTGTLAAAMPSRKGSRIQPAPTGTVSCIAEKGTFRTVITGSTKWPRTRLST
jgi:hypothetical protein